MEGPHLVHVEVAPGGGWQRTFREVIAASERFPGEGELTIALAGQGLEMAFPGRVTHFTPELVTALQALPGVLRVRAEPTSAA